MSAYSPAFEAFAAECSAAAIHRQDVLNDFLGTAIRRFNLRERTLTGEDFTSGGVTSLGSFSHLSQTWLWTWDNPHYSWEHPAVAPLRHIFAYGERHHIPELTTGHLDLSHFPDPHQAATTFAIGAAYILNGNGVWSCRINEGKSSAYIHLDDPQMPVATFDPAAAPRLLLTATSVFPADHRRVVRGFFERFDLAYTETPAQMVAHHPTATLTTTFDSQGRLTTISTTASHPA